MIPENSKNSTNDCLSTNYRSALEDSKNSDLLPPHKTMCKPRVLRLNLNHLIPYMRSDTKLEAF
jgi:hypothetical protein